jgi:hypothetical protein
MATGYTEFILEGATFEQFAERCIRAFASCADMRDQSLSVPAPTEFKPSTYYLDNIKRYETELKELENVTLEMAQEKIDEMYTSQIRSNKISTDEAIKKNNMLLAVLEQAKAWVPPTELHTRYKEFMIEQVTGSLFGDYHLNPSPVVKQDPEEWLKNRREYLQEDIERSKEKYAKEVKRCEENTLWVKQIRDSLGT